MPTLLPDWPELQGAFVAALRDPAAPPPGAIGKTGAAPSAKRFSVYRNNVAVSLIDALAANFPVTAALIGEEPFAALARSFMASHLPETPMLMDYGQEFAGFITGFDPLAHLGFLADVARLERVWNTAYNAADLNLASIETLSDIAPDALERTVFEFHPAAGLVRSAHPIASIWFAHQGSDTEAALKSLPQGGEDAWITRPVADVQIRRLPAGAAVFVERLLAGDPLGDAAEAAADADDAFDAAAAIGGLFESGAVSDLTCPT
ncbi:Glutamate synthase [NADPH] large chain [hydrothermal vent metagenome]|uniref:Glutamate synthase [NADPH] large chain n=1 Tax=hydrothermal vent metagenome TaxID=652676 RepID=A0A3B0U621_9ZZZZ